MTMRYATAILAYVVPTFILGFVWHLVLFDGYYDRLAIYRDEVIIPFGLLSMLVQACIFAVIYDKVFAARPGGWFGRGLAYAATGAALSWSYTTIAVAAKHVMTSVPDYLLIETAFTAAQWTIVGPFTALAFTLGPATRARSAAA